MLRGSTYWDNFAMFKGVYLPKQYEEFADMIENFHIRDDDVWVCTFPKSGTTWTQEMVWCISNDLDFEGAKVDLFKRFPFFEMTTLKDNTQPSEKHADVELQSVHEQSVEYADKMKSPRFIKTHLPFHLLPRDLREGKTKAKIIYVTRNPKDICISYWYHHKRRGRYSGTLEEFCNLMLEDKMTFCPLWEHVLGYWNQRNNSKLKILYLKFEEMKADLASVITKTTKFLEKPHLSSSQMELILHHLSFAEMKKNSAVNHQRKSQDNENAEEPIPFMRCGETNQWKSTLPPKIVEKIDERTASYMKTSDFVF